MRDCSSRESDDDIDVSRREEGIPAKGEGDRGDLISREEASPLRPPFPRGFATVAADSRDNDSPISRAMGFPLD